MTKTESHTVGEWLDKSQSKDLSRLREDELLAKFDDVTIHTLYGEWCREKRDCLWSSATPKNISDFVKYFKREKQ